MHSTTEYTYQYDGATDSYCYPYSHILINKFNIFREGNGRTARIYFKQLCANAGYDLTFHKTTKETLLHADVRAFNKDYAPLIHVLDVIVTKR